jgi:hypothetical protein
MSLQIDKQDTFEIADEVIEKAYPDYALKGKGWWGCQRIPNYGILRGAIEQAIRDERKKAVKR